MTDETGWAEDKHLRMAFGEREKGSYTCSYEQKEKKGQEGKKIKEEGGDKWVGEKRWRWRESRADLLQML